MAIIKCKMCGGDLEIQPGQTVGVCEYCGTKQTLPRLDDDQRANLYDRANHFRRNNEFDKAMGIYERILNEDKTDAESYWSLVLCRYGIEYVEDPATHKRVPTVNRAQFTSIFDDDNYKSALQYADGYQRGIYEAEARAINEIQKGILAISQKEEPFDVFICYKESDNNGRRTPDSVLANDLYHQLTQEGFKVFFSRITLEDKLGSAYEPYIFAALNSAKVMVVLGTRPEYFNAVWVKNEWSRYLSLIKQGQKKMLIPAYKDMDPYDLPEEFSHLQAQDMGKLGFMQDLIRGIKKITQTEAPVAVVEAPVVATVGSSNVDALLERGNMALEDGDWDKAMGFFEDVLNNDARNAQAYLGETLALEHCRTLDAFIRKRKEATLTVRGETQKLVPDGGHAVEIAEKYQIPGYCESYSLRNLYEFDLSYHSDVAEREAQYHAEERYWDNHKQLSRAEKFATGDVAKTLQQEKQALFAALKERIEKAEQAEAKQIARLKESYAAHIRQADEKAEELYQNAVALRERNYQSWLAQAKTENDVRKLRDLTQNFASLNGYADSKNFAEHCRKRAEEEQAKVDAEKERLAAARKKEAERVAKRNKRIAVICSAAAVIALAGFILISQSIRSSRYHSAVALMDAGQYEEAIIAFEAMDGYKDSVTQIENCNIAILDAKYNDAIALMNAEQYEQAISVFEVLDGYKDSVAQVESCNTAILDKKYDAAIALFDEGKYVDAYEVFTELAGYRTSSERASSIRGIYQLKTADIQVGDVISFGSYEQDNNARNGVETIRWRVLDRIGNRILVVSAYALDCKPYNETDDNVTWETCTLRKWLNSSFFNTAFTEQEKTLIPAATVSAEKNPEYNTDPGNTTQDEVVR